MPPGHTPAGTVDIDASLVTRLIAVQFPQWAHLPIEPVEFTGWDNRTFHLGDEMSVRLPSAAWYADQVEKEQRWLPVLAPRLPLPIPAPLAMGTPAEGYPWHWSIYRWLEGEDAAVAHIDDLPAFATELGRFLVALQQVDPSGGPPPGRHNFFRGGSLSVYDAQTRESIAELRGEVDEAAATSIWETALASAWHDAPVWVHGDVSAANLLVTGGRLSAVIDFGCSAVGDPACDLTIAWTQFGGDSREAFRMALALGEATWARGRGWALWKALITLAEHIGVDAQKERQARQVITDVLAEDPAVA